MPLLAVLAHHLFLFIVEAFSFESFLCYFMEDNFKYPGYVSSHYDSTVIQQSGKKKNLNLFFRIVGNSNRAIIINIAFAMIGLIFIIQLFMLQVIDPSYKYFAESNTQRKLTQYPSRGLIYDRNGQLMVSNQPVYDIMIVPRDVVPFDTLEFSRAIGLPLEKVTEILEEIRTNLRNRKISSFKPSVFYKQLPAEQYAVFQEKMYQFKGFFAQRRIVRKYEYPHAAHVLGYVAEANEQMINRDRYYSAGDYTGVSGIETTYENFYVAEKGHVT
jgi:penicillin-binding protein 2